MGTFYRELAKRIREELEKHQTWLRLRASLEENAK